MLEDWLQFDQYKRILDIRFKIKTQEPLHIGAGKGVQFSPVDLPVIKYYVNGNYFPVILGSSIKGILRSIAEYVCSLPDVSIKTCKRGDCGRKYREFLRRASEEKSMVEVLEQFCIVCKLFGTEMFNSRLRILDAFPDIVKTEYRTGVAINRRSGSAKTKALYELEYIPAGINFYGRMIAVNTPNYLIGLIFNSFEVLNNGIFKLGGFKSRGFGLIKISDASVSAEVFEKGRLVSYSSDFGLSPLDERDTLVAIGRPDTYSSFIKAWENYVSTK